MVKNDGAMGSGVTLERRADGRPRPSVAQAPSRAQAGWRVAGCSVRGAAHVRAALPNQDALSHWSGDAGGVACAAAAVADGHGGPRHFRSATGARLAVEIAVQRLRALAPGLERCAPAERSRHVEAQAPAAIVGEWVEKVRADLAAQPIRDFEWAALAEAEDQDSVDAVRADPLLAYGATLLAALVTPSTIVLLQLGDGDMLCVAADGSTRRPVAADERLAGNRTTSICRPGAEDDVRLALLDRGQNDPALLLLSTDGYANSFRSDDDFLCIGDDFRSLIARHGLKAVDAQLETILQDASAQGSGDDITLALLQNDAVLDPVSARSAADAPIAEFREPGRRPSAGAERQIARLRLALGAALLAVAGLAGWILFPNWHRHVLPTSAPGGRLPTVLVPQRDPGLVVPDPAGPGAGAAPVAGDKPVLVPLTPTLTPKGGTGPSPDAGTPDHPDESQPPAATGKPVTAKLPKPAKANGSR